MATFNSLFIFPNCSAKDFNLLSPPSQKALLGASLAAYIMLIKAQITVSTSHCLSPQEIQQLPSQKALSSALTNDTNIRIFAAAIAVSKTIGFEASKLTSFTDTTIPDPVNSGLQINISAKENREKYIFSLINDLANNKAPRGCTVLPDREINANTLASHRYAIMASYFGHFQNKPIYEPHTLIKGYSLSSIKADDAIKAIYNTLDSLGLVDIRIENSEFLDNVKDLSQSQGFIDTIYNEPIRFNDENLLPLESALGYKRITPEIPEVIECSDPTDELLMLAINAHNENAAKLKRLTKNNKKVKSGTTNSPPSDPIDEAITPVKEPKAKPLAKKPESKNTISDSKPKRTSTRKKKSS